MSQSIEVPPIRAARRAMAVAVAAMAVVVLASNILVQYPVPGQIGPVALADLLTFGAFTYPAAFLVTDLTNRQLGPGAARSVVRIGFVVAVALSVVLATPRIAAASGAAFLVGQLLDISVFNRLRRQTWWRAPFAASILGSIADTAIFFTVAFAPVLAVLGEADPYALEISPLLATGPAEAARWVSWSLADLSVKLTFAVLLLAPYRIALDLIGRARYQEAVAG